MISPHEVTLCTNHTVLRPFRDEDLYIVLPWNSQLLTAKAVSLPFQFSSLVPAEKFGTEVHWAG
jgi:hypothetical protein